MSAPVEFLAMERLTVSTLVKGRQYVVSFAGDAPTRVAVACNRWGVSVRTFRTLWDRRSGRTMGPTARAALAACGVKP